MVGNLHKAKKQKNDEFYTRLEDIERELRHYKKHFKDKIVYCNCDDPQVSNFFHYFSHNFKELGLKKLIATCYKNNKADSFSKNDSNQAVYLEYNGSANENSIPNADEIEKRYLKGDGDFRNEESLELLKQADIVVTNPPFSLFREYVAQLIEHDKKFLIIGSLNALSYKEVFSLIKENKIWLGFSSGGMKFEIPQYYENKSNVEVDEQGRKWQKLGNVGWFTNLDISKRHEDIILFEKFDSEKYQKYENFDAININKTKDIPVDYNGIMGVPITFLEKYNPEQFEIIGLGISSSGLEVGVQPYKKEHKKYRKEVQKRGTVNGDLYMMENGIVKVPYARILIKNKKMVK